MSEFILQADPLEFQNSRQSTKIMFLQQELHQLQDHVKDLEQIVRINKEALRIASFPPTQTTVNKNKPVSTSEISTTTTENSSNVKMLQTLVQYLQEENIRLLNIIEKVKQERNIAQSKVKLELV